MAKRILLPSRFYVYVLFRHDTGQPFYVGKGSRDRWTCHDRDKAAGRNRHKTAIIQLAKSAGSEIVRVKIASEITEAEAFDLERVMISAIGRVANGGPLVNLTDGGEGQSGYKHTEETRVKIGAANRGKKRGPMSPEQKLAISITKTGGKLTPEHAAAISKSNKGQKRSPEFCAQTSARMTGRTHSDETKRKISETLTGRSLPDETKAKISESGKLRVFSEEFIADFVERSRVRMLSGHSPETKAKISAAKTGVPLSEEGKAKLAIARSMRGPLTDETRQKLSAWQLGKPRSDEDRQKMRDGWANRKALLEQQKPP